MTATPSAPRLGLDRLLLIVTGSVSAADMPFWSTWLRTEYPDLAVRVLLTRSARRFVTAPAIAARLHCEVSPDTWEEDAGATHVELWHWAEAALVYPCTFDYLSRLALGRGDSPGLLALQCATVPVVVAPALPPGGAQSAAYQQHVAHLRTRRNVRVVPPQPGRSSVTGRLDAWAPQLFPLAVGAVEAVRQELETPQAVAS